MIKYAVRVKMTEFYNRIDELTSLKQILAQNKSNLINMYGRRRIGKTTILKELIAQLEKKTIVIYYVFNYEDSTIQWEKFYTVLLKKVTEIFISKNITKFSWEQLFQILFQSEKRIILLLDEFPFITDKEPGIPSIIQNLRDEYKNKTNLNLLLCGSLVSSMQELMGAKQPLYGRFTYVFHIKSFSFAHSQHFFRSKPVPFEQQVMIYGIFGGIPFYMQAILQNPFNTIKELLIKGPFEKFSFFREEIPIELRTFTRTFTPYFSILIAIASNKTKYSEINNFVNQTKDITKYLDTLIKLDIIERKESKWTKKKLDNRYYIKDVFYRFWFRFFFPYANELALLSAKEFVDTVVDPNLNEFFGLSFEKFCQEMIIEFSKRGIIEDKIAHVENYIGTFKDPISKETINLEIDIVAPSIKKEILIIGECKWWTKKITAKEIDKFVDKKEKFLLFTNDFVKEYKKQENWYFTRQAVNERIIEKYPEINFINLQDIEKKLSKE